MIGLKLNTGDGRNGGRSSFDMLPIDNKGEARDEYTKLGGAAKIRLFDTIVKVGDVFPSTPVVAAGDSRLLPESFRGVTIENTSIQDLTLQGGRLHAMSQPFSSDLNDNFVTFYGGPVNSPWIGYGGRGRNGSYLPPPAQIRTCGTTAYGSCLGYVTRSDPQGKDVHFWVSGYRDRQGVRNVTIEADYAGCVA